ncbi:MAG TPA: pectate lyase [Abditibacteriaceae bacterium]
MKAQKLILFFCSFLCLLLPLQADVRPLLKKPAAWFTTEEARQIAANVLSQQSPRGDWPKNGDTTRLYTGNPAQLQGTFDNGATVNELRFLAKMFEATKDAKYERAFLKGLDHILNAQYPSGGWPQTSPPGPNYPRHITFNDNTMLNLMQLLREVAELHLYSFVDKERRAKAQTAFDKGIECILQCQIKVNGNLTVWCAQHDEITFEPRAARAFELVSFSGFESVGLTRLLMSLDKPSHRVQQAVRAAMNWFEKSKLNGVKVEKREDENAEKGYDLFVVADPNASPLWARFYDIQTNQPIFVSRDGVPRTQLADISYERRTGYAWYGDWPAKLEKEYQAWSDRRLK